MQDRPRLGGELVRVDGPADEVLDQGLGHGGVDVVVRHVIAHAVGGPSQRQLTQIACPYDEGVVQIRQPEEVRGALAGLDILEGDVVDGLAGGVGVADVAHHL